MKKERRRFLLNKFFEVFWDGPLPTVARPHFAHFPPSVMDEALLDGVTFAANALAPPP